MDPIDCTPPEYILPGSRERPLCPLQPQNRDWKVGFPAESRGQPLEGGSRRSRRPGPSHSAVPAAPAVPEGAHHERLEPAPWEPQDARGPHVPVCDHGRGPASQHHGVHAGLLPEPVSLCAAPFWVLGQLLGAPCSVTALSAGPQRITLTPSLPAPASSAIPWWSCSTRSARPSKKTSLCCRRKGSAFASSLPRFPGSPV